jgi:two-component system sensor histidine kinase MtrB
MRLSLRWRVAVAFGLGSLALTSVLAVTTWQLASGYMLDQREVSATQQAEVNVRLVDASLHTGSSGLEELLTGLTTDPNSSILLRRPGRWLTSGRQLDPTALPQSLLDIAHSRTAARQRLMVGGIPVLAVGLPLSAENDFYLQLFPLEQLDSTFRFLSTVLMIGTALSALFGVTLGFWTSRRALHPLTVLTAAASRMAGGDLTARVPQQDDPDLRPLAASFNATADALEHRVRQDARFAGDVSHELRSPLTIMVNAAEVLRRRKDDMPTTARHAVDLLTAVVHRFHRMVVDLLEISRGDQEDRAEELEEVELVGLVRHVLAARPCADVPIEHADPPPVVRGDRRRLDRVFANLLDNAEHHAGGPVRIGVRRRDGQVRLEVDDNGPGVPVPLRERVFERFARGTPAGRRGNDGGSGLGLALVAQHVRRHHGQVWVEDRPGGGARFVVELPEAR